MFRLQPVFSIYFMSTLPHLCCTLATWKQELFSVALPSVLPGSCLGRFFCFGGLSCQPDEVTMQDWVWSLSVLSSLTWLSLLLCPRTSMVAQSVIVDYIFALLPQLNYQSLKTKSVWYSALCLQMPDIVVSTQVMDKLINPLSLIY